YKTSGSFGFDNRAVQEGKKLQLPLYALAAQQGLKIGDVQEGFYFHVQTAEPSSFKMSSYWGDGKKGPEAAMESAVKNGWKAVSSIRDGQYKPKTPDGGCPLYCPAVDFCWHFRAQRW
ncbi:MAG: PD-(D/E)XK nuclease family protein, partial [Anaerolineales bacterium]|nr:PD-(D/E)XK nuclease family protein [Anaerolineales bacterium]